MAYIPDPLYFLAESEMGKLTRDIDWSKTSLGPAEFWPVELKTILAMIFRNPNPLSIFWGEEAFYFYNDALIPIVGAAKHPKALGSRGSEVWEEIWEQISPQIKQVMTEGVSTWNEDRAFSILGDDRRLKEVHITYSYSPVYLTNGQVGGALLTSTETTLRKKFETDLVKSEASLKLALLSAQMGTWEVEPVTNKVIWSKRTNELFGLDPMDDFPVESAMQRIHPDDRDRVREAMENAMDPRGKGEYKIDFRVLDSNNSYRWLSGLGQAYFSGTDQNRITTQFSGVTFDITKIKNTEAELRDAVSARDEFLSIASHELKTPISSIKMQIQMGQREINIEKGIAPSPEKLSKIFSVSARQVDRLVTLIDELLDVTKIGVKKLNLNYENVNLTNLVTEICERYKEEIQKTKCSLKLDLESDIAGFWDAFRIEQVITNLLSNAIKYGSGNPIEIGLKADQNQVKITVTDFGIGIPQDSLSRIFERFERAVSYKNISGLGLGLFIAKEIIEVFDGSISVDSVLGKGSTFTVVLPRNPLQKQAKE